MFGFCCSTIHFSLERRLFSALAKQLYISQNIPISWSTRSSSRVRWALQASLTLNTSETCSRVCLVWWLQGNCTAPELVQSLVILCFFWLFAGPSLCVPSLGLLSQLKLNCSKSTNIPIFQDDLSHCTYSCQILKEIKVISFFVFKNCSKAEGRSYQRKDASAWLLSMSIDH